ncbi:MAG TPA: hypothetical protein DCP37_04300 [Dehalococcoidia bacterium]|jgi:hypothetical protein|nr:hypothetical protein [Dehalococcoidia bacterium]|tara:strand:+ start:1031 stop:1285 length:255 start_codon:yes stop_codon:yes gene_type:complete
MICFGGDEIVNELATGDVGLPHRSTDVDRTSIEYSSTEYILHAHVESIVSGDILINASDALDIALICTYLLLCTKSIAKLTNRI